MDLKKIARTLERERCVVHFEKPTATVKRDSIELSCCCKKFETKLITKMESMLAKQVTDEIKKAFR
ncbi:hypothetical protein R9C00_11900 [Flammeovirgaceae bacterium SG7u.111]|nr:hypothetical protein [Flammeovirgaceae bacterium SG7u.132]WPO38156.1 hypothetical protein R9C00_11900 [Flammeovirgaceae bacterium SG7u.111]